MINHLFGIVKNHWGKNIILGELHLTRTAGVTPATPTAGIIATAAGIAAPATAAGIVVAAGVFATAIRIVIA